MSVSSAASWVPWVGKPKGDTSKGSGPIYPHPPVQTWKRPPATPLDENKTYVAHFDTTHGPIAIRLRQDLSPIAAANFAFLANENFFDRQQIYRMRSDFVLQSGDPTAWTRPDGTPGYNIQDDPVDPQTKYSRGTLGMANMGPDAPNSGSAEFFVMLSDGPPADHPMTRTFPPFGEVISGWETLDRIAAHPVVDDGYGETSKPVNPERLGIYSVRIEALPPRPAQATQAVRALTKLRR